MELVLRHQLVFDACDPRLPRGAELLAPTGYMIGTDLDVRVVEHVAEAAGRLGAVEPGLRYVAVNAEVSSALSRGYWDRVARSAEQMGRVALQVEITEREPASVEHLRRIERLVRDAGALLVLDDLGDHHATAARLVSVRWAMVKVGGSLLGRARAGDPEALELLRLARRHPLVYEGVESIGDLSWVAGLARSGDLVQGFALHRPEEVLGAVEGSTPGIGYGSSPGREV